MEGVLAIIVGWVVVAQYGQQGTNEFSNAYNACMTGKGW